MAVEQSTWTLSEIPKHLVDGYLKHIVGFRLCNLKLKSCFRLNQGKGNSESLAESLIASGNSACKDLAMLVLNPPTVRIK